MKEGLIEEDADNHYERLKHTIRILITFWLSQQEVLPGYRSTRFDEMSHYVWRLIYPHMTEEGKREYQLITEDSKLRAN